MMIKAVFLDRDGVINKDTGYVARFEDFCFLPMSIAGCQLFSSMGYKLFIVTNQSGIARGFYTFSDYLELSEAYIEVLRTFGVYIEEVMHCPHLPEDNCNCRKPKIGMISKITDSYNIDLNNSCVVGDKMSDVELGINAHIKYKFLINNEIFENNTNTEYIECNNIYSAALLMKSFHDKP